MTEHLPECAALTQARDDALDAAHEAVAAINGKWVFGPRIYKHEARSHPPNATGPVAKRGPSRHSMKQCIQMVSNNLEGDPPLRREGHPRSETGNPLPQHPAFTLSAYYGGNISHD
jgi:hypothetical protein